MTKRDVDGVKIHKTYDGLKIECPYCKRETLLETLLFGGNEECKCGAELDISLNWLKEVDLD